MNEFPSPRHAFRLSRGFFAWIAVPFFLGGIAEAQMTLLQDDFARGTPASPSYLNGSSPAAGTGVWTGPGAADTKVGAITDGTEALLKTVGSNTACSVIPITPSLAQNTEYSLSVSIPSFNNRGDSWVSVGISDRSSNTVLAGVFMRDEGGNWIMRKADHPQFQEIFDGYSANDPTNPGEVTKIRITVNTGTKVVKVYLGESKAEDYAYKYPDLPVTPDGVYAFIKLFSGNGTAGTVNSARFTHLLVTTAPVSETEAHAQAAEQALLDKIAREYTGPLTGDSKPQTAVPHGEYIQGKITDSKIYPGTENAFTVYVPAQYDPSKAACVLVKLDGLGGGDGTVLDNLIAKKDIPPMIGVGVVPGLIRTADGKDVLRFNRSYEFDSVNDHFPNYVLNELLPAVEKLTTRDGRPIHLSHDGNDRMTFGGSTGGIGSFTLAWERPDAFRRVYSIIGTFVSMRGGHEYPALIRKTDPKPIRIFLEDGSTDAWNPLFGSWYMANVNMEAALSFAGYDVQHIWGDHGHDGRMGTVIFPDVMRWLWRDWPKPLEPGRSQNDMLRSIQVAGEDWSAVGEAHEALSGLASNQNGEVFYADSAAHTIYKLGADGTATAFVRNTPVISGAAFGPDGSLYVAAPEEQKILAYGADGQSKQIADGVKGHSLIVSDDGSIYVTEPGAHSDEPSKVWKVKSTGEKSVLDAGLSNASGLAFLPDKQMFFVAEAATKWVYSYVVGGDGSLQDKEQFYWLHSKRHATCLLTGV